MVEEEKEKQGGVIELLRYGKVYIRLSILRNIRNRLTRIAE